MMNSQTPELNPLIKFRTLSFFLILQAVLCILGACGHEGPQSKNIVATVNGKPIYREEYEKHLSLQKGILSPKTFQDSHNKREILEEEFLDVLITEKIMLGRAEELKLTVSNTELEQRLIDIRKDYGQDFFDLLIAYHVRYEDWREQMRTEMLIGKLIAADVSAKVFVTDGETEDFYNDNPDFCKTEAMVHAAQIVVRDAPKAADVKARLNKGEDFAKVAKEVSIGPEAIRGGDLGMITRQTMPEALDKALFQLPAGQVSGIVSSPYGYHILKVTQKFPAQTKALNVCKEDIKTAIRFKKEEAAFTVWLEGLKLKAVVKKEPNFGIKKTKTGGNS